MWNLMQENEQWRSKVWNDYMPHVMVSHGCLLMLIELEKKCDLIETDEKETDEKDSNIHGYLLIQDLEASYDCNKFINIGNDFMWAMATRC